jgi:FkbM family methyltransferase
MSLYIFDEIFVQKIYDLPMRDIKTIIDIGANTGMFVIRSKDIWPSSEIFAFEPEPNNFAMLERAIRINDLSGVTPINSAITNSDGVVNLYIHPRNIGGHSTIRHELSDIVEVKSKTLDDVLSKLPFRHCDLLKVDCEGAEEAIFRSLTPDVARRIGVIVYEPEWGLYSVENLNSWLESFGFKKRIVGGSVVVGERLPPEMARQ